MLVLHNTNSKLVACISNHLQQQKEPHTYGYFWPTFTLPNIKIEFTNEVRQNSQLQTRMSRMFYRICESMYCSIVRVRVWTALCVFKTFVLPWQRLRKKFKPMGLSQLTNLTLNLLKISQNSEKDTPHPFQLRPLTSREDTKSKSDIMYFIML